jgi:hypothetical protein
VPDRLLSIPDVDSLDRQQVLGVIGRKPDLHLPFDTVRARDHAHGQADLVERGVGGGPCV